MPPYPHYDRCRRSRGGFNSQFSRKPNLPRRAVPRRGALPISRIYKIFMAWVNRIGSCVFFQSSYFLMIHSTAAAPNRGKNPKDACVVFGVGGTVVSGGSVAVSGSRVCMIVVGVTGFVIS